MMPFRQGVLLNGASAGPAMMGVVETRASSFSLDRLSVNTCTEDWRDDTSDMVEGVARESVELVNAGRLWELSLVALDGREKGRSRADT